MINSSIGIDGTMWYFAIWNLLGTFYCMIFLRETQGLTDFQKKTLYAPVNKTISELELADLQQDQEDQKLQEQ